MARYLLITAVGVDQPGLVAGLTETLLESGANVEDSSMTRIRHDFAMMLLVRLPDGDPDPLRRRLAAAGERLGLTVTTRDLSEEEARGEAPAKDIYHVNVYGADRAGIVHGITRAIAERGASITDLRTTVAGTPERPIYVMLVEASAPAGEDPQAFTAALLEAGAAMDVDVTVQLLDSAAL